jgi:hypothetical protein
MSDTPRTDANVSLMAKIGAETIVPDFARILERENNSLKEENANLKDKIIKLKLAFNDVSDLVTHYANMARKL